MASGFTIATNEHLVRSNLWSRQLKELLLDDLIAMKYVRILQDFPDGTTFNIPSLGEAETADYVEGQAVKYNKMDTGNFVFEFDQYKVSANSLSEMFKQDSFWAPDVQAAFLPRQHRSLMENIETRILSRGNSGQTASDLNIINGRNHRWVGSGTNETIALKDFSLAKSALKKANVPMSNLVAIVDDSVAFALENLTNVTNLMSPMPKWDRVISDGITGSTGMQFQFNLYGFDVYVSNYLPSGIAETISGKSVTTGVANLFFSAAPGDTLPIIGGFRQHPTVYTEFNKDLQQTECLTIMRYGFKLYRPENMVVVLTDTDQVA